MQERRQTTRSLAGMREPCQVKGCGGWAQVWDGTAASGYCVDCWREIRELEQLAFLEPGWDPPRLAPTARQNLVAAALAVAILAGFAACLVWQEPIANAVAKWFGGE